jgi:cytosine/adenosine deaminase-related metal-dependent hydrolase
MPFVTLAELARRAAPVDRAGPLRCVVTARVVYEGFGTPREDAAVALFEDEPGKLFVTAVGPREEVLAAHPRSLVVDAGLAVGPAPVNAHTHLDLSDMPFTPGPYEAFLRAVIAHGREGRRGEAAARRGVAEVKASGVRTVGDVVTDPAVMELLLSDPDLSGVAYWEVFGPDASRAGELLAETVSAVNRFRALERPGGVRVGVSPHTPHTVSAPLMRAVTAWARAERLPVAIHVAETPAERELFVHGTGALAEAMAGWGFSFTAPGVSPVRYLKDLGALEGGPTLVHMVAVDDEDVRMAQAAGCVVVHCPRSNEALLCGRFPWETFARHGADVAMGTDSRGSSPDLDVVAEARRAVELHGSKASPRAVVRAAVKGGYRALGMQPPRLRVGDAASAWGAWA